MPVGALTALLAFAVFLSVIPTTALLRHLPFLFACALAGTLLGVVVPLAGLVAPPLAVVAGAAWLRARWDRLGGGTGAGPARGRGA